jgi:hypothetical protein
MASSSDWFKNTTWTPEIAAEFEQRIARSRADKRHQLTTQASLLVRHGVPDVGLALYRRAAELPKLTADERTLTYGMLARALISLLRFEEADEAARAAVGASVRTARMMRGERTPEELLAFALRQRGAAGDDEEALALLADEDPAYRESLEALRDRASAVDLGGQPYADAEDLAEAFTVTLHQTDVFADAADVDALFAASPAALAALDRAWCRTPPFYGAFEPLRRRGLFEAGGYVGRVLCRAGATWEPGAAPASSTVRLAGRSIDPFAIAFEALFRFKPLARSFAELVSRVVDRGGPAA